MLAVHSIKQIFSSAISKFQNIADPFSLINVDPERELKQLKPTMQDKIFNYGITTIFLVIIILGSVYHEFWRDEAYTWLLLDSAESLEEFIRIFPYSGHPNTWYVFLYILKSLWNHYSLLQITNSIFIVGAAFLFLRFSPFERYQKLLFCFGFFPLYQYGIISRPYSLIVFLLFAYAVLREKIPHKPILPAIVLSILISLHVFGLIAGLVILFFETVFGYGAPRATARGPCPSRASHRSEMAASHRSRRPHPTSLAGASFAGLSHSPSSTIYRSWSSAKWDKKPKKSPTLTLSLLLISSSLIITTFQLLPQGDAQISMMHKGQLLDSIINGFLPKSAIPSFINLLPGSVGMSLFLLSWFCFRKNTKGFFLYLLFTIGLATFIEKVYTGHIWHHGFFYIFFILSYWMSFTTRSQTRFHRYFLTALLFIHAVAGLSIFFYDITHTYSSGKLAATYITDQNLENMNKIGIKVIDDKYPKNNKYKYNIDEVQSTLIYLKNRNIYDPIKGTFVTYWKHYNQHYFHEMSESELIDSLNKSSQKLNSALLVIVPRLNDSRENTLPEPFIKLKDFPDNFQFGESISIYMFQNETL